MSANNQNLGSNLVKVDLHEISSKEYDELPELTELGLDRGVLSGIALMEPPRIASNGSTLAP